LFPELQAFPRSLEAAQGSSSLGTGYRTVYSKSRVLVVVHDVPKAHMRQGREI
jgi:hypothetical protein